MSDITYIPTREGWLYLATVLDVYSRAIVGWAMSRTLDCKLAKDALSMPIGRRGPPAVLHSDQGTTYAPAEYRELVGRYPIRQSMSRKGDCWELGLRSAMLGQGYWVREIVDGKLGPKSTSEVAQRQFCGIAFNDEYVGATVP